jgi:hypothetical protein
MKTETLALILLTHSSLAVAAVDEEQSARGACMLFTKQMLHDPGSATFEPASYASKDKNGVWTVQRHLRARNGYNAIRKMVVECNMKLVDSQWKLLKIQQIQ